MEQAEKRHGKRLSGRALGLVLIFLTAIIWVAASFVSQLLVSTEEGRPSYNVSPFLLTYLSTSIFTVFLPLVQLKGLLQNSWLFRRRFKYKPLQKDDDAAAATNFSIQQEHELYRNGQLAQDDMLDGSSLQADLDAAETAAAFGQQANNAARASTNAHKEALIAAAQCFLLWFTAQYLFNTSLSLTSVTSNTVLSSTSSLFTFALSMIVLKEPYSLAKLLSIAACIGGTLLVTLSDKSSSSGGSSRVNSAAAMGASSLHSLSGSSNETAAAAVLAAGPSHSVWGDLLCLVSACFYAGYTIVLKKSLPDEEHANVALFFGYVGLLCSLVFLPVLAVLAALGSMHLSSISTKAYLIILVEGILNYCLSDYLWAHAVLLLGPTVATLGLSVQIPVAAVVDVLVGAPKWLANGHSIATMLSGTTLILLGFFAGNLAGGGYVCLSEIAVNEDWERRRSSGQDSVSGGIDGHIRHGTAIAVSAHACKPDGLQNHHGSTGHASIGVSAAAAVMNGVMSGQQHHQLQWQQHGTAPVQQQQHWQPQVQLLKQLDGDALVGSGQQQEQQQQQQASIELSSVSSASPMGAYGEQRSSLSSPLSAKGRVSLPSSEGLLGDDQMPAASNPLQQDRPQLPAFTRASEAAHSDGVLGQQQGAIYGQGESTSLPYNGSSGQGGRTHQSGRLQQSVSLVRADEQ